MELQHDIRWIQRYANFHKACTRLLEVTENGKDMDEMSELELEGLVQRFEYTFELAWKVLQDLLIYKGASANQIKPVHVIDNPVKEKFFFGLAEEEV